MEWPICILRRYQSISINKMTYFIWGLSTCLPVSRIRKKRIVKHWNAKDLKIELGVVLIEAV